MKVLTLVVRVQRGLHKNQHRWSSEISFEAAKGADPVALRQRSGE